MKTNLCKEGYRELQQELYFALDEYPMNIEKVLWLSMQLDEVILSYYK